jgi:hypothetical protein
MSIHILSSTSRWVLASAWSSSKRRIRKSRLPNVSGDWSIGCVAMLMYVALRRRQRGCHAISSQRLSQCRCRPSRHAPSLRPSSPWCPRSSSASRASLQTKREEFSSAPSSTVFVKSRHQRRRHWAPPSDQASCWSVCLDTNRYPSPFRLRLDRTAQATLHTLRRTSSGCRSASPRKIDFLSQSYFPSGG